MRTHSELGNPFHFDYGCLAECSLVAVYIVLGTTREPVVDHLRIYSGHSASSCVLPL